MAKVVDPVCQMVLDSAAAAGQSEYNGCTFYFCTAACKREFDQNPAKYYGRPVQLQQQTLLQPRQPDITS
jgi:Cu+-exporting ATPase